MSLYPLAICCAAVAVIALRDHALPRWLGTFAAITAVALAVNAGFLYASFVPAPLLFLLWTLVTGIVLLRRVSGATVRVVYST
jgi:amino acid transporter